MGLAILNLISTYVTEGYLNPPTLIKQTRKLVFNSLTLFFVCHDLSIK